MALKLSRVFGIAGFLWLSIANFDCLAQTVDYPCYWQLSNGTVQDLSHLCHRRSSQNTSSSQPQKKLAPDDAFVADFQARSSQYAGSVSQYLKTYIKQDQQSAIAEAQVVCRILKFGGKTAELTRRKAIATSDPSAEGEARRQVISQLAQLYYCPGAANS